MPAFRSKLKRMLALSACVPSPHPASATTASTRELETRALMLGMVLMLTALNGLVPNAASGGDRYRAMFTIAIMLVISGITLTVVPIMTELIFGGLVVDPAV